MDVGLVPLSSIRFAIAESLPSTHDESAWLNPCMSSGLDGIWDDSSTRTMYANAAAQSCAAHSDMCLNPVTELLSNGLVDFYFPIGDDTINTLHTNSAGKYQIFVYMDVSTKDNSGMISTTKLFIQAPITTTSVMRQCDTLRAAHSLKDIIDIDLSIGITGSEALWSNSVREVKNIISNKPSNPTSPSKSLQSALVTMIVKCNTEVFQNPLTANYHIEIDDLVTLHFLDPDKYNTVNLMLESGSAYTTGNSASGHLSIILSQDILDSCAAGTGGDFSCAVRRDISDRVTNNNYAIHSLATGVSQHDDTGSRNWLTENLLGVSEFSAATATNFTRMIRDKNDINDRYTKAYFINPGFDWPGQSPIALSDKMVAIVAITLDDGRGDVTARRRVLLEVSSGTSGISFKEVNNPRQRGRYEKNGHETTQVNVTVANNRRL